MGMFSARVDGNLLMVQKPYEQTVKAGLQAFRKKHEPVVTTTLPE